MKKIFSLIAIFFLNLIVAFADTNQTTFNKANSLYQKGNYEDAAKLYEEILKGGNESAAIYFNLGNVYYKLNNTPKSILNFERAKRLASADEDIDFNLKLANLKVVDKIEAIPQLFYNRWWHAFSQTFSLDNWAIATVAFCWLTVIAAVFFILARSVFVRKLFFFFGVITLVITLFSFFLAQHQNNQQTSTKEAIVFESNVYVKSSPDEKSVDLFILHEGSKVQILDEIGAWQKIKLANGNEGWMKAEGLEVI